MNGMKLYNFLEKSGLAWAFTGDFAVLAADEAALQRGETRTYGDTWSEDGRSVTVKMAAGKILRVPRAK